MDLKLVSIKHRFSALPDELEVCVAGFSESTQSSALFTVALKKPEIELKSMSIMEIESLAISQVKSFIS